MYKCNFFTSEHKNISKHESLVPLMLQYKIIIVQIAILDKFRPHDKFDVYRDSLSLTHLPVQR